MDTQALASLSDDELLRSLRDLGGGSRRGEAALVAFMAEVDSRKLYTRLAMPSMSAYCTRVLHFSEAEARLRIAAARVSRDHPLLLGYLAEGRLSLSTIAMLAPYITPANEHALVPCALDQSKRAIRELVSGLPTRTEEPSESTEWLEELESRATAIYLAEEDAEVEAFLRQEQLQSSGTAADLPRVDAVRPEPRRDSPPMPPLVPTTIHPKGVDRDGGRCRFLDAQGRRCPERMGVFPSDLLRFCPAHLRHRAVRDNFRAQGFRSWRSKVRSS
jgi:hypothetical protein